MPLLKPQELGRKRDLGFPVPILPTTSEATVSADDRHDKLNLAGPQGILNQLGALLGQHGIHAPQTNHRPLRPLPPSLSTLSLLAGMQGPLCQKVQARQKARRHRWF